MPRGAWLATALLATVVGTGIGATALTGGHSGDARVAQASGPEVYEASARSLPSLGYKATAASKPTYSYIALAWQEPVERPQRGPGIMLGSEPVATPEPEPAPAPPPPPPPPAAPAGLPSQINNVNVTFYDCVEQGFCGTMYSGATVYEGAAACSWDLPIGTAFRIVGDPTQRTYICEDRGLLTNTWVDIFWYDASHGWVWQDSVGRHSTIEIIDVPS